MNLRQEATFSDKYTSIALITLVERFDFKESYKRTGGGYFELIM